MYAALSHIEREKKVNTRTVRPKTNEILVRPESEKRNRRAQCARGSRWSRDRRDGHVIALVHWTSDAMRPRHWLSDRKCSVLTTERFEVRSRSDSFEEAIIIIVQVV